MVHLKINAQKKISSLKEEFNKAFPFLKLEFFKHKHKTHGASPKEDLIREDLTIGHFRKKFIESDLEITDDMSVSSLEQLFQREYGVSTQVFRKSGRSWIETTVTDDWTLKRQNDEGMELGNFTRSRA